MIGQVVSHYKILERLGGGGMGVVYKAEDTHLKRTVALKFLPPAFTLDPDAKARFKREAEAASALDHPNVCTIYDVDESDEGQIFIAMTYYEGETLKKKIEDRGLKIEDGIEIAIEVAQGLAAAHEHGIIHRDVKPANIIVTAKGEAKILDFGLAKLAGEAALTKTGSTLGTVAYASPEQARGEEVDRRSDIFSLGVVLYEMITGRRPFGGEHEAAVMYSIMNETPEPLARYKANVPEGLQRVIDRSLAKEREDRYQHIDEMLVDLRRVQQATPASKKFIRKRRNTPLFVGGGIGVILLGLLLCYLFLLKPAPAGDRSVAVIPFVDMSPGKDQDYFCDGITEELINRLTKIRDLRVPARTSAFMFKGKTADIREIGSKLNVETVLEGSVRKAGNGLRITAQLINAADGYHLWSETYDRELKDVFAIQDEISSAIVSALQLKLTSQEKERLSAHSIDNVKAYDCYLKASRQIMRFDEKSLDSAFSYLKTAIEIMGDNAQLYSGMARVSSMYANIGVGQEEYLKRAEEYAKKAILLQPDDPTALAELGSLASYEDYPGNQLDSYSYYKKALAADPFEVRALHGISQVYLYLGKPNEAFAAAEVLERHDPLNPRWRLVRGFCYQYDCQFRAALEDFRAFYSADSTSPLAQTIYSYALACNGLQNEALNVIKEMEKGDINGVTSHTRSTFPVFNLLLKDALLKDRQGALRVMTPDFQKTCRRDFEWSYWVAVRLSLLGSREEALDWLGNAVKRGFINYHLLQCDPFLDNIRGEERFAGLLKYAQEESEKLAARL